MVICIGREANENNYYFRCVQEPNNVVLLYGRRPYGPSAPRGVLGFDSVTQTQIPKQNTHISANKLYSGMASIAQGCRANITYVGYNGKQNKQQETSEVRACLTVTFCKNGSHSCDFDDTKTLGARTKPRGLPLYR